MLAGAAVAVPVLTAPAAHAATAVLDAEVVRQLAPAPRPLVTRIVAAARSYTIVSGDTLSGIAGRFCGSAGKWPSLFNANHKVVKNADMIYPGQKLTLTCDGSMVLPVTVSAAAVVAPVAAVPVHQAARHTDQFDGHHGACGDGDGDGMDAPCSVIFPGSQAAASDPAPHRRYHRAVAAVTGFSGGGTLSFAGLEALWVAAGGPAWAEAAAATVAECESGGRASAFNPSGATGLWQILGSVVGGNLYDPMVNAENAVSKFRASGSTWAQWVCRP
jgi:LysM repeat protein